MLRLLRNLTAANVGSLQYSLQSWHIAKYQMRDYHQPFFHGQYDVSCFHQQSQNDYEGSTKF